jgi:hypothetical protein
MNPEIFKNKEFAIAMERNTLTALFGIGCIVAIIGFAIAQYFLTLIVIAFIILAFLYPDFKAWRESGQTDLKKIEQRVEALEKK